MKETPEIIMMLAHCLIEQDKQLTAQEKVITELEDEMAQLLAECRHLQQNFGQPAVGD